MFQKKDYIMSESYGVCQVDDITKMVSKEGKQITYYVLKSVYNKKKVSYIPVENHKVQLRTLISKEEASNILSNFSDSEKKKIDEKTCGEVAFVLNENVENVKKQLGIKEENKE